MNMNENVLKTLGFTDEQIAAIKAAVAPASAPAVDETAAMAELTTSEKITVNVVEE